VNVGSGCAYITRHPSCSLPSARALGAEDAYPLTLVLAKVASPLPAPRGYGNPRAATELLGQVPAVLRTEGR